MNDTKFKVWHDFCKEGWIEIEAKDMEDALDIFCKKTFGLDHMDYCKENNLKESDINIEEVLRYSEDNPYLSDCNDKENTMDKITENSLLSNLKVLLNEAIIKSRNLMGYISNEDYDEDILAKDEIEKSIESALDCLDHLNRTRYKYL